MYRVIYNFLYKDGFPAIFDGHIEFLRKMQKRIHLGNGARYSHFNEIFDLQGIHRVIFNILLKIIFQPLFGGHIEFLHKMQKLIILVMVQDRAISAISKSVTYFWVIYHMVKLQIYSSLHS